MPIFLTFFMFVVGLVEEPFEHYVANIVILQDKKLQQHLKITEAQRKKMNAFAERHSAALAKYGKELEKTKKSVSAPSTDPKFEAIFRELKDGVLKQLTPAQIKRLAEVSIQMVGTAALSDERVCKKVGVSTATMRTIQKKLQDSLQKAMALQNAELEKISKRYEGKEPKNDAERKKLEAQVQADLAAAEKRVGPKVEKLKADTEKQILAMLTPAQRQAFQALQGAPYKP
jgi:ribosomal protein L28